MKLVDLRTRLANYETYKNWRRPLNTPIDRIVIHHTGAGTVNADGSPRLDPTEMARLHVEGEGRAHVSYHYSVARDGTISYLLDEEISGYHLFLAVPSRKNNPVAWQKWNNEFKGGQLFNFTSIAIVVLGWFDSNRKQGAQVIPDNHNAPTPEQLNATLELVRDIQKRRGIPVKNVEGHSEILTRTGFGTTTCPGALFSMTKFREAIPQRTGGGTTPIPVGGGTSPNVPKGPVVVPDPAPPLRLVFKNRPLVGLHARNDSTFTATDWAIIRNAKVESLKMMSQTQDSVYEEARRIDPKMEFIVRLFSGRNGQGNELPPDEFVNFFRDTINRLFQKFGVLKFEIHNEPNHLTGHEGWGQTQEDALNFQAWYKRVFAGLRANHPWALLGYPGLAVPHNDLQWLDWTREAIEMSDWLGVHPYWQTPPQARLTFKSQDWGQRYLQYHAKYPHKLLEVTEFGNSNGQSNPPIPFSREEQRDQYVEWFSAILDQPYIGSAHGFLATSPDPVWVNQGFAWGDAAGPFPVAEAIGKLVRPKRAPDWYYAFNATVPPQLAPGIELSFPAILGNGGRLPWIKSGTARSAISGKWVRTGTDGKDEVIEDGKQWLELPHDMVSGDVITFRMKIITPVAPGNYKLRLAVYHHGHQKWLHDLEEVTEPDFFATRIIAAQPAPPPQPPAPTPTPPQPPVPTPPAPPAGKFGVVYGVTFPPSFTVGERISLPLTLTNSGTRPWVARGANPVVVAPQWLTLQGQPVDTSLRTSLPTDVLPQEKVTVTVSITAPSAPGTYFLRLDMAEEGKLFFSQQGSSPLRRQIEVKGIATLKEVDAEWLEVRVSPQLPLNGEGRADVRLRNRGKSTWEVNAVRVAYHWGDNTPVRVQLPTMVATGQEVALGLPLKAPAATGLKTIIFDLWREGTGWLQVPSPGQQVTITEGATRELDDVFTTGQSPKRVENVSPESDSLTNHAGLENEAMPVSLPTVPALPDQKEEGSDTSELTSAAAPTPALVETVIEPVPHAAVVAVMVSENTADVRLAIDGDPMTAWRTSGKQQGGEWIQVDFGREQSIRTIRVENLPEEFPRGYRLEGSTDGETWTVLATAPENHDSVAVTLSEATTARFIKLTQTNRSPFQHWSVVEVAVE